MITVHCPHSYCRKKITIRNADDIEPLIAHARYHGVRLGEEREDFERIQFLMKALEFYDVCITTLSDPMFKRYAGARRLARRMRRQRPKTRRLLDLLTRDFARKGYSQGGVA